MFGFGKKARGIETPDLSQRPFTKALLAVSVGIRRGLHQQALQAGLLNERLEPEPAELDQRIGLALQIVPPHIVRETIEALDRAADFLPIPGNHLPLDAPAFMTFASFAALALYVNVKREGFALPLGPFVADLANSVFYRWPPTETAMPVKISSELYQSLIGSKSAEVAEWINNCAAIVTRYIEHYGNETKAPPIVKACGILISQIARAIKT